MTEKPGDEPQPSDGASNGGNGEAAFASIDFDDDQPDGAVPFLPPGCDLFPNFTPDDVERMRAAGRSPTTIRVMRFQNGRRVSITGSWPVDFVSTLWLTQNFGQGVYDVQCLDQSNMFMKQKRHDLQAPPPHVAAQQTQAGAGAGGFAPHGGGYPPPQAYGAPPYGYPPQVQYPGYPPAPPKDDSFDKLLKILTLKMATEQNSALTQIKLAEQQNSQTRPMDVLVMKMLEEKLRDKPKKESGGVGDIKNAIAVLKLANELGNGKTDGMADLEWWQEFLPQLVDTCGPGAIALVAQATLKEDRAKAVLDMMEQHQKNKAAIDAEGMAG